MMQKYPAYKDSDITWVDRVPEHWQIIPIKHFVNINPETLPENTDPDFALQYIDIGSVSAGGLINPPEKMLFRNAPSRARRIVNWGDTIISTVRTYLKAIAYIDFQQENLIASTGFAVLRPNGKVDPTFLRYAVLCHYFVEGVTANSVGVNYPAINSSTFGRLKLAFPTSLSEQKAIADYLEDQTAVIDKFITNKRRLIELLEEQKQVVINTAVTQGLDTAVARKPSGIDWLGDIPAHWEIKKIGYVAEVGNGSTPSRSNMRYWKDGTYPWLNSSSVNQGVITEAEQFVTPTALNECHLPIVKPNSVLVAITGQGKTRGTAALLTFEATINQHMAYITPSSKVLTANYLVTFLQGNYHYLRYISDGQGGTKGALTCSDIKQLKIPIPPPFEQEIIVQRVKQTLSEIKAAIERTQREIDLIEEYRTTLIAHAVTGKIDVRSHQEGL